MKTFRQHFTGGIRGCKYVPVNRNSERRPSPRFVPLSQSTFSLKLAPEPISIEDRMSGLFATEPVPQIRDSCCRLISHLPVRRRRQGRPAPFPLPRNSRQL